MNQLRAIWRELRKRPLVRNTGWLLAGQGFGLVLQAVYFVILARLLGAAEYGVFIGAFAFTSIVAQYSSLGTGMVLLRYVSLDRTTFAVYWGNVLFVTFAMGVILTIALRLLSFHLLNPASAAIVTLASIANCICAQLTTEAGRAFRAFERMPVTAGLNLLTNLMRALAATGMFLCLHKADARQWAVASMLVSSVSALLAIAVITVQFGLPRFKANLLFRHGVEGVGYSFAQSTTTFYNDVDKTMLSYYGLNQANGIYTVAYRIIDIATIPISSLHDAALPKLFQLGRHGILPGRRMASRILRTTVPFSVFISAALFAAAPILPRIVGGAFAESASALRWLCLIPVCRSVHTITGAALTGAGLQRYRTVSQVLSAALNLLLNFWAIPHYGWLGAAWSSLITDGFLAILNCAILIKIHPKGFAHAPVAQNSALPA